MVVIDEFYANPDAVRSYALDQAYYTPYQDLAEVHSGRLAATWWTSQYRSADDCPFKSSQTLVRALEEAVREPIDMVHWRAPFPFGPKGRPAATRPRDGYGCVWNCSFHVKPDNGQQLGQGIHNHVTDQWNACGAQGWAGIIYLSPNAPLEGGLHLWRNVDPSHRFDWMTPAENWERLDSFANLYNRLILVRGDIPHSGAGGWGETVESGRLYQTFFFRTATRPEPWPVELPFVRASTYTQPPPM